MDDTEHKQVIVKHPRWGHRIEVDEELVELLQDLWEQKISTGMSCQEIDGKVWLMFDSKKDFIRFLEKVDFVDISLSDIRFRKRDNRILYDYVSVRFPVNMKDKISKRLA